MNELMNIRGHPEFAVINIDDVSDNCQDAVIIIKNKSQSKMKLKKQIEYIFDHEHMYSLIILSGFEYDILSYLLESYKQQSARIFLEQELLLRIPYNMMQPTFSLATDDDMKYFAKYHITLNSLPKLLYTDPVRRWFNWKKGDVIKCISNDDVYYRIVF